VVGHLEVEKKSQSVAEAMANGPTKDAQFTSD